MPFQIPIVHGRREIDAGDPLLSDSECDMVVLDVDLPPSNTTPSLTGREQVDPTTPSTRSEGGWSRWWFGRCEEKSTPVVLVSIMIDVPSFGEEEKVVVVVEERFHHLPDLGRESLDVDVAYAKGGHRRVSATRQ